MILLVGGGKNGKFSYGKNNNVVITKSNLFDYALYFYIPMYIRLLISPKIIRFHIIQV